MNFHSRLNFNIHPRPLGGGAREWSDEPRTEAATDGQHAAGGARRAERSRAEPAEC